MKSIALCERDRISKEIRKDRKYLQPLGNDWRRSNRLIWQIKLLLGKPRKQQTIDKHTPIP